MNVNFQPWQTPNFMRMDLPNTAKRQDGFKVDSNAISIKDVDAEDLSNQCDKFRQEIFKKANKKDPKS